MRVVLHTNERVTAEALRLALLAEGIDASVRGQHLRALGLPLTVAVHHNEEYEHAVRIREAMELDVSRSTRGDAMRLGLVIAAVMIVSMGMWWALRLR